MPHSAAIYCRISKDRVGAGLGVDRQSVDCQDLAEHLGWNVTAVHTDNDMSAYSGKPRPGYNALLADMEAGRADGVIAWHTDRLHRSPVELERYIAVCDARGIATHCVKAGPLDLATPSGRLVARQLGAVARYEVEHMIERQKSAKLQAAQAGRYRGGRRAFGYEADGVTVRDSEADHVRDATQRVLHGESLASIARDWTVRGVLSSAWRPPLAPVTTWTSTAVHDVLVRARNAGIIEHSGDRIARAKWPAIVGEDAWQAVRVLLSDPARRRSRSVDRRWLGSGLFLCGVCGDGTTMRSASTVSGNGNRRRAAYRCKAGAHLGRVAEPVDEQITALVIARLSRPDARLLLVTDTGDDADELATQAAALRVRLDELVTLFAGGVITASQLAVGTAEISGRLTEVERRTAAAAASSPLVGFAEVDDVAAAWDAASVSRRKAVVDALMTVTLLPAPRGRRPGGHYFEPGSIQIDWKGITA